ncbi:MAG: sulfatase-like hydrolase/transferase [Vicinamibacterales bacterium]
MSRPFAVILAAAHLLLSGAVMAWMIWRFELTAWALPSHLLLLGLSDAALLAGLALVAASPARRGRRSAVAACRVLPAALVTAQAWLYVLNIGSNLFWGRNISGALVLAFAPSVLTGAELLPVGPAGIAAVVLASAVAAGSASRWWGARLLASLGAWREPPRWWPGRAPARGWLWAGRAVLAATTVALAGLLAWGIQSDWLLWSREPFTSFVWGERVPFAPTARRRAVAERDAALRAAYPRPVPGASRRNVVLIIVDALRADRMQVYGYRRPTTPFLSGLEASGRLRKVETAYSTCAESFCGITSTLSSREYRDLTPAAFQLQDVLADQGYRTWFLLAGHHRAWNGLSLFYHAADDALFDGSGSARYAIDDDRVVLEGLERVPPAAAGAPAFFYLHLMTPHYMGVLRPEWKRYSAGERDVRPGRDPQRILDALNDPDRYDDKVTQADDTIRQIFGALDARGYLDNALVVIAGDHGEGLGERHWGHGFSLYDEDIRIPLLFVDTADAEYPPLDFGVQLDIAPTIVDRLGLPAPASWMGRSLLAPASAEGRFTFHQTTYDHPREAVVFTRPGERWKYVVTLDSGVEELYDLVADPGERSNLIEAKPAVAARMREALASRRASGPG